MKSLHYIKYVICIILKSNNAVKNIIIGEIVGAIIILNNEVIVLYKMYKLKLELI